MGVVSAALACVGQGLVDAIPEPQPSLDGPLGDGCGGLLLSDGITAQVSEDPAGERTVIFPIEADVAG